MMLATTLTIRNISSPHNVCHNVPRRNLKIYTKTGDKGQSSLFNGERRSKADAVFEALGSSDELNSALGVAREHCQEVDSTAAERLATIQHVIFDAGASIATPRDHSPQPHLAKTFFEDSHTGDLEKWIDEMEETLPPLKNFILPGGGKASSHLHMARAICRRTERRVVNLQEIDNLSIDPNVPIFLNRLSDYLFVLARQMAAKQGAHETIYQHKKSSDAKSE
eukprot:TRINITY_DN13573_c0_g1_i1.p1 TRINITY_DN13573_c0_g1~~TRINITY_DN13573_c0_g1_i1.p1  ORF type:complete len:223 (+),score=58.13 TRINITY_DN13573_c0_g1_i1:1-669(+)